MADPMSMMVASTAASGLVSGIGASTSAGASAASFNYKAGIAQLNAQIARQNAAWVTNSGGIKAQQEGLKDAQEIAQTKAGFGASGIDAGTGSHAGVTTSQTDVAKYNQGIIRADAAHTAYGYETKAAADEAEASMDRAAASNAEKAGKLGVLSSIIGSVGSVASKWMQGSSIGMGSGSSPGVGMFDPNNYGAAPAWGN